MTYIVHVDNSAEENKQPEYGAFKALRYQNTSLATQSMSAIRWSDPFFSAALSNSIYKEYSTVQPKTLVFNYAIKY